MEITEVRIKLMDASDDRLQAFCSITFDDCFVVRDLKIIEGASGPFVAMPSRKMTAHCSSCHSKNHSRAAYCNQCGKKQTVTESERESDGRSKLYADIAHPINTECREMIQNRVIREYQAELEHAGRELPVERFDEVEESATARGPHNRGSTAEENAKLPSESSVEDETTGFGRGIFK